MSKLIYFIGATVGGWVGWYIGLPMGMFAAFMVSMVGTGFGIYAGHKAEKRWL